MRSRTKPPKENNSKPRRYLPSAGFCSKKPSATKVEASRCAVLLATCKRLANTVMPNSGSSALNILSKRKPAPTDERSLEPDGLCSIGSLGLGRVYGHVNRAFQALAN